MQKKERRERKSLTYRSNFFISFHVDCRYIHTSFFARKSATHFLITSALSALATTAINNPLAHHLVFLPGTVNNFVFLLNNL
jgi:hypothetical protein